MANHSLPTATSTYTNFVSELDARFDDLAIGLDPAFVTATNVPTNTLRFSSASAKWQRWNGTAWVDAVATYAIAISGNAGSVTNGVYTTGSYANPAWITSLAGSKITGNITGNAGTATTLATARTINGVSFDGSANITVNTVQSITFSNAGTGAASGTTFNGSAARTISYNTIGAPSTTGAGASGTWGISITGNAATATSATSATTAGSCTGNAATATTASAVNTTSTITSTARVGMRVSNAGNDNMYELVKTGVVGYGLVITSDNRITLSQTNGSGTWTKTLISADTSGNTTVAGALNVISDITTTGSVTASGDVTAYSDERLKLNWRPLPADFLERLAQLKMGIYERKDNGETQVGVGAQSLQAFLPQAIREGTDGMLSVAYGNAALAACVVLAQEVLELKRKLGV